MIVSVKIRTIAIALAFLLIIAGVFGLYALAVSSWPSNKITIVLDAGHGGFDGGVVGKTTGVKESDINLAITKATKTYLKKAGYNVVLTRSNSEGLYSVTDKNKKLADFKKRKEIIEQSKPALVVSIHQNFYPIESVSGPQVFYWEKSEVSKEYARIIQNTINAGTGGKRVAMKGDYYILQCTEYPSVLIECGFLSNPTEEKLLVSAEYQQKMAYLIYSGIHTIISDGLPPYHYLSKI